MRDEVSWRNAVERVVHLSVLKRMAKSDFRDTCMTQAVMLAGGRGARLSPHTDLVPKPLVEVAGKPFLEHLLESLVHEGITKLLILAGYRSSQIVEATRGLTQRLSISVIEGAPEWSTGERLLRAGDHLEQQFILLYTDNLTVFSLTKLQEISKSTKAKIVLSACSSPRGNLIPEPGGSPRVARYLLDRSSDPSSWVEVGFSLIERSYILSLLHRTAGCLPQAIAAAAAEGAVSADYLPYPYHSIGDPERLHATRQVLAPRRVLLIDRDGLVNVRPPKACYVEKPADVRLIDSNISALATLGSEGFQFVLVTNQAGIGRGVLTARDAAIVNDFIVARLAEAGVDIIDIYQCPHSWDAGCGCRKPQPGMLLRAAREHNLYLPKIVFAGDDERDVEAGNAARCQTLLIQESPSSKVTATLGVFPDLYAALPALRNAYNIA